jgi:hypothetical protein
MVHVSVQVVSSYVTPWLNNTCLISVISFVMTLYNKKWKQKTELHNIGETLQIKIEVRNERWKW